MTVSTTTTELLILLQPHLIDGWNWMGHHLNLEYFLQKLDCCFQGQDHSEGPKLYRTFVYLKTSVPLISWQPKKVCLFAIHNNQTKYNKVGI